MRRIVDTMHTDPQKKQKPMISVIVSSDDSPLGLAGAVQSAVHQSYEHVEIIVVGWKGTIDQQILDQSSPCPIRLVERPACGPSPALKNAGIEQARGDYIAYLDARDRFYPNHLESLIEPFLQDQGTILHLVYSNACLVHKMRRNNRLEVVEKEVLLSPEYDPHRLLFENYIPFSCVLHRRSCIEAIGGFDESLDCSEDWDFLIRLARLSPFHHLRNATCELTRIVNSEVKSTTLARVLMSETRLRTKHLEAMKGSSWYHKIYPFFSERINMLLDLGYQDAVFEVMEDLLDFEPDNGAARRDLAFLYSLRGDSFLGAAVLQRPGMVMPKDDEVRRKRDWVETLAHQGKVDKAQHIQEDLLAQCPTDAEGYNNLGVFAWIEGKTEKAYALFRLSIELDPMSLETLKNLARVCLETGNRIEAMHYCKRAVEIDPKNEEMLTTLSKVTHQLREDPRLAVRGQHRIFAMS